MRWVERDSALAALLGFVVQAVFEDFAAQRIAVNSEKPGCFALISFVSFKRFLDKFLLKLTYGILKSYPSVNHLTHKGFQFFFHIKTPAVETG